jgi:non-homologous end joining protein Ku
MHRASFERAVRDENGVALGRIAQGEGQADRAAAREVERPGNVISLMDALRQSVGGKTRRSGPMKRKKKAAGRTRKAA